MSSDLAVPLLDGGNSVERVEDDYKFPEPEKPLVSRWVSLVLTMATTLMGSGPIFGWPSLYVTLVKAGIYASKCTAQELIDKGTCDSQSTALNLIFTVSSFVLVAMFMVWGTLLDYLGPRKTIGIAGSAYVIAGCVTAISFSNDNEGGIFFGIVMFAACGPGLFVPCMLINNAFPGKESTVIAIINALFDASTLNFFVFQVLDNKLSVSFFSFSAVFAVVLVATVVCWPPEQPKSTEIVSSTEDTDAVPFELSRSFSLLGPDMGLIPTRNIQPIDKPGDVKDRPFMKQLCSAECLFMLLFMVLCSFRIVFYLGTVNEQLAMMNGGNPDTYVQALGYMLPMCCFAVPVIGFLLDTKSMEVSFWALSILGMIFHALCCIQYLPLQILSFLVFTTYRSFIYSAQSAYVGSVFGYLNFGRLMGVVNVCGGSVGLLQFPLLAISLSAGSFLPVNLTLLALAIVAPCLPFFGYRVAARRRLEQQQKDAVLQ